MISLNSSFIVILIVFFSLLPSDLIFGGEKAKSKDALKTLNSDSFVYTPELKFYGKVDSFDYELQSFMDSSVESIADEFVNGGRFKQGEVILVLEDKEVQMNILECRIEESEAQKELAIAEAMFLNEQDNLEFLKTFNVKSESLSARKQEVDRCGLKLEAVQNRLNMLESKQQKARVKAPFDCLIIEKNVDAGNIVSAGSILARICKYNEISVPLDVKFEDLSLMKIPGYNCKGEGSRAVVNGVYEGNIAGLESKFSRTSLPRIIVLVKNNNKYKRFLRAGQFCNVKIEVEQRD